MSIVKRQNKLITILFQDVIGKALARIGPYESLNNTQQVVALINDVSTTYSAAFRFIFHFLS